MRKPAEAEKYRLEKIAEAERNRVVLEAEAEAEAEAVAGTNCIKIGLPGKLILSKRKGLWEVVFS